MDAFRGILTALGGSVRERYRYLLKAIQDVKSDEAGGEEAETSTLLRYKLDADERGVLNSARVSDSIRAVTGQEQMNVRRLSAEAEARGEDVVNVKVHYRADIVDGKLAIRAGRTEVVSRPRSEGASLVREYEKIGNANRDAAASTRLFDTADDASLRSLSAGLTADEGAPDELETITDIFGAGHPRGDVEEDETT